MLAARRHKDIPSPEEFTPGQNLLLQATFVILGVSCLAIWGGLLNMLHDLEHLIYPGYTLGDTLLATCMTTVLIMTITWIALDRVSIRLIYLSCAGITASCFLIAICVTWVPGYGGVVFLHIICLMIGVFKGTLYPMAFGLAGVMPVDKGGACAVGLGLAGVYSLLLYLIFTVWGFTVLSYEDLIPPFWAFSVLLSLPSISGPILLYVVLHRVWCFGNMGPKVCEKLGLPVLDPDCHPNASAAAASSTKDLEKERETDTATVPGGAEAGIKTADADAVEDPEELEKVRAWKLLPTSEKVRRVAIDCWKPCFSVFWAFFVTLQLYPNVGPLAWDDGRINSLYMMAAFQGLEYIARTGCDLWAWELGGKKVDDKMGPDAQPSAASSGFSIKPFYMFKPFGPNFLLAMVLLRTVFIPLFVFCMVWNTSSFWGALWWHYVIVGACGFTLGWAGSLSVYFAPNSLSDDKPKTLRTIASQAMVLSTNTGIWVALWIGKLYFL